MAQAVYTGLSAGDEAPPAYQDMSAGEEAPAAYRDLAAESSSSVPILLSYPSAPPPLKRHNNVLAFLA